MTPVRRTPLLPPFLPLLAAVCLAILAPRPAPAGTVVITVTPSLESVETSRLILVWNAQLPEVLQSIVFKDYDANVDLAASSYFNGEFWGQSLRGLNSPGFIQPTNTQSQTWQVTAQSTTFAQITITSQAFGQPVVQTRYTIRADVPWFVVDRTIRFSTLADTASYQAYVPRMPFLTDYRALRWRDGSGTLQQRGFCASPCVTGGWDGRWLQQLLRGGTGQAALGVTSIFAPGTVSGLPLVRGSGPQTASGWGQPRVDAGAHTSDRTWSQMVSFSTSPDDLAALDALYASYASGAALADVGGAAAPEALRLAVSPNPARGPATLAWTNAAAGENTLEILDVAGRRIVRLASGERPAGPQHASWDGRRADGARVAPGLYLARLVSAAGTTTATIVRAN